MFKTCKKPPMSIISASGSICTFNTLQSGLPLKSHTIALTATQSGSGTPSPDNVRTINGYSNIHIGAVGANVWNEETKNGYYHANGGYYVNVAGQLCSKTPIDVLPNTTYRFCKPNTQGDVLFYDENGTYLNQYVGNVQKNGTFTTPSGCYKININLGNNYGATYNNDVIIAYPSGTYITIQIGSTVYGGEYDARTGLFVATQVKEILRGSYFSTYSASIQCVGGGKPAGWLPWLKQTGGSCEMLSHGLPTTRSNIGNISNGCFIGDTTGGNQEVMYIKFAGYSSLEDVQTFIEAQYNLNTPVEVVYKLATPITIQLPPCPIDTLEGVNNIWADTGNTSLEAFKFGR